MLWIVVATALILSDLARGNGVGDRRSRDANTSVINGNVVTTVGRIYSRQTPFLCRLGYPAINDQEFSCSCAVIAAKWVVSATHCTYHRVFKVSTDSIKIIVATGRVHNGGVSYDVEDIYYAGKDVPNPPVVHDFILIRIRGFIDVPGYVSPARVNFDTTLPATLPSTGLVIVGYGFTLPSPSRWDPGGTHGRPERASFGYVQRIRASVASSGLHNQAYMDQGILAVGTAWDQELGAGACYNTLGPRSCAKIGCKSSYKLNSAASDCCKGGLFPFACVDALLLKGAAEAAIISRCRVYQCAGSRNFAPTEIIASGSPGVTHPSLVIDACNGDSGGPLIGRTQFDAAAPQTNPGLLFGVTVAGTGQCGAPHMPGLYAPTSDKYSFIRKYIPYMELPFDVSMQMSICCSENMAKQGCAANNMYQIFSLPFPGTTCADAGSCIVGGFADPNVRHIVCNTRNGQVGEFGGGANDWYSRNWCLPGGVGYVCDATVQIVPYNYVQVRSPVAPLRVQLHTLKWNSVYGRSDSCANQGLALITRSQRGPSGDDDDDEEYVFEEDGAGRVSVSARSCAGSSFAFTSCDPNLACPFSTINDTVIPTARVTCEAISCGNSSTARQTTDTATIAVFITGCLSDVDCCNRLLIDAYCSGVPIDGCYCQATQVDCPWLNNSNVCSNNESSKGLLGLLGLLGLIPLFILLGALGLLILVLKRRNEDPYKDTDEMMVIEPSEIMFRPEVLGPQEASVVPVTVPVGSIFPVTGGW